MDRRYFLAAIAEAFRVTPVVALIGPRQCGKTTLARAFARSMGLSIESSPNYFDLEDPRAVQRLENPMLALESLNGLVVLDEIQRRPELFPVLRVMVDREPRVHQFLILGSASPDLLRQTSESLAGRITYLELTPFQFSEAGSADRLWLRGGFPPSFLADTDEISSQWRRAYIRTFLERDIPELGLRLPPENLRRFWMMLAHYHGQLLQSAELGRSLGISDTTVRRYLDILVSTFMVRRLGPWFENIGKRQVKTPKIYIRDTGILHELLNIATREELLVHPKLGASWEGFALEEVIRYLRKAPDEVYFWGVQGQSELDLVIVDGPRRTGFEFKYADAPKVSASLRNAMRDLSLERVTLIVPGRHRYPLEQGIDVAGLQAFIRTDAVD